MSINLESESELLILSGELKIVGSSVLVDILVDDSELGISAHRRRLEDAVGFQPLDLTAEEALKRLTQHKPLKSSKFNVGTEEKCQTKISSDFLPLILQTEKNMVWLLLLLTRKPRWDSTSNLTVGFNIHRGCMSTNLEKCEKKMKGTRKWENKKVVQGRRSSSLSLHPTLNNAEGEITELRPIDSCTGTWTTNRRIVEKIWVCEQTKEIKSSDTARVLKEFVSEEVFDLFLHSIFLNTGSEVVKGQDGKNKVRGSPMETTLLELGSLQGGHHKVYNQKYKITKVESLLVEIHLILLTMKKKSWVMIWPTMLTYSSVGVWVGSWAGKLEEVASGEDMGVINQQLSYLHLEDKMLFKEEVMLGMDLKGLGL